ncbi:MAG: MFS transporter [Thermoleophilia bacterium]
MDPDFVAYRTRQPADTARERARLWRVQLLMAAAVACGSIGAVWLAATMGAGAAGAAAVIVAGLLPVALATPLAAWVAGRVARRTLLWSAPATLAAALVACDLSAEALGVGSVIACAMLMGVARVAFDGVTADVLHQLVDDARRPDATRDLTARFGAGSALGLAGALGAGLLLRGPEGAILFAGGLALAAAVVAARHHPDLDLRMSGRPPLTAAVRAALRVVAGDAVLRRVLVAGAWSTGVGAAQAAVLIVWLKDGVGLRGALVPALMAGFAAVRLSRPLVRRLAARSRPGSVLVMALGVQAAASLTAYALRGAVGAAAAYALSLAAGVFLGVLVNRALRIAAPAPLAPAVGLAAGAVWALAACAGAAAGGLLATGVGLAGTHLVLAAVALTASAALAVRAAAAGATLRPRRAR